MWQELRYVIHSSTVEPSMEKCYNSQRINGKYHETWYVTTLCRCNPLNTCPFKIQMAGIVAFRLSRSINCILRVLFRAEIATPSELLRDYYEYFSPGQFNVFPPFWSIQNEWENQLCIQPSLKLSGQFHHASPVGEDISPFHARRTYIKHITVYVLVTHNKLFL